MTTTKELHQLDNNCNGLNQPITQAMKKQSNPTDPGDAVALVHAIMKTQNKESKDSLPVSYDNPA